jgi:rod shape-determining protein MreC
LPVGVVDSVEKDPDRDGFIQVVVQPAARLNGLDEVLVITDTEPRFNDKQLKDLAKSESEKSADAAALNEQKKASEILEEKLPGLTDPNAPKPAQGGAQPGATGANGTVPAVAPAPKLVTPQHADRFTPGYTGSRAEQTENQNSNGAASAPRTAAPKPAQPATQPGTGTNPAPRQAPGTQPGTKPGTVTKPGQRPAAPPTQQAPQQKTDRLEDTGSKPDAPKPPASPNPGQPPQQEKH